MTRAGKDAPEYAAIQALIDEHKDKGVFFLATVNFSGDMPDSLLRAGRFGHTFDMDNPEKEDSEKILAFYMKQKELDGDVDIELLARIMCGSSCAEIEEAINRAGLYAAYAGKEKVGHKELLKACFNILNCPELAEEGAGKTFYEVAVHEIGHVVIAEVCRPGSVIYSSLNMLEKMKPLGVTKQDALDEDDFAIEEWQNSVLICLGGKAAVDVVLGKPDMGCSMDITDAKMHIYRMIARNASFGFDMLDYADEGNGSCKVDYEKDSSGRPRNDVGL